MIVHTEIKIMSLCFIISLMLTSGIGISSAISVSASTTTDNTSSIPIASPSYIRSMDSSEDYSTPPRASDSIMTALNPMVSRASEFQATQNLAVVNEEYVQ